jgi:H+-transporting ATPase
MTYSHLTDEQAEAKIKEFGLNEIPDAPSHRFRKLLKLFLSPMNLMLVLASVLSFFTKREFDGFFIIALLFLNVLISFWHEQKADATIQKLRNSLTIMVQVLRSDIWKTITSRELVSGDVVRLKMGAIIPADGKILEASDVSCNESALTGESLPVEKKIGDMVYSGSYLVSGVCIIAVTATGIHTRTGKTIIEVEVEHKRSQLDDDVLGVTRLLMLLSALSVLVISLVLFYKHQPLLEILSIDLSLVIAGIPISLPTVMSLIVSIGVMRLAEKKIIVRRLSSLQNLSGVSLLLSDKTGTLTKNRVEIAGVQSYAGWTEEDATNLAIAAEGWSNGVLQQSARSYLVQKKFTDEQIPVEKFTPYNSDTKHSETIITWKGEQRTVIFGAPQVVVAHCALNEIALHDFIASIDEFAGEGYRTMSLAIGGVGSGTKDMSLVATFLLSDTVYEDASGVIAFMKRCGIATKMVTGDNHAIGTRVAKELGVEGEVVTRDALAVNPIKDLSRE